jgi:hypothetical protein
VFVLGALGAASCTSNEAAAIPPYVGCDAFEIFCDCPAPATGVAGAIHGVRSDGRVDVNAKEAWPDRPRPQPFPTASEVAQACTAFAACRPPVTSPIGTSGGVVTFEGCLRGGLGLFDVSASDRVIPLTDYQESWSTLIQSILAANGECSTIRAALTIETAPIQCQEDGCWLASNRPGTVTCEGDLASIRADGETWRRDCSRANARCSRKSPTGCTDRQLVRCDPDGRDRCDGDVKLGCDHCGLVSYHDCSWNGGHCEETAEGAGCVDPMNDAACPSGATQCEGSSFTTCVQGQPIQLDCVALGDFECRIDSTPSPFCSLAIDAGALCSPRPYCTAHTTTEVPDAGGI